jgi:hypothetical protein
MERTMTVEEELEQQERILWEATARSDGDYYRANVTDDALFVFPYFVMDKARCADAVDASGGWSSFAMDEPRVVRFGENAGIVVYRATAQQGDGDPYVAYMSTAYVRRDGSWKVAYHQQTPVVEAPG